MDASRQLGDEAGGIAAPSADGSLGQPIAGPPSASPRVRRREIAALAFLVIAATITYTWLSWVRYQGFFAGNWDLGINMQLLWTNTHGYLLYESGDYEISRANSFLYVHPTYVAIPLSYLYRVAPEAATLFALQAFAIALGAIPLYLMGRRASVPGSILFAGILAYLVSLPVLAGFLFDFHWEAFVPAEFLWTFYLWSGGKRVWTIVPASLGVLTIEVFPVLLVGIVLYDLVPLVVAFLKGSKRGLGDIWRGLKGPALPPIGLFAFALVGYFGPYLVAHWVLPSVTGYGPIFSSSGSNTILGRSIWGANWEDIGPRLLYWFLLVAAFGFLPLLFRQRLLLLSLPWFVYSVFMAQSYVYTRFGFQYSLIALAPLAIGLVEGLGALLGPTTDRSSWKLSGPAWSILLIPMLVASLAYSQILISGSTEGPWIGLVVGLVTLGVFGVLVYIRSRMNSVRMVSSDLPNLVRRRRRIAHTVTIVAVAVLVGTNLALSPLDSANFLGPGEGAYSFSYAPSPTFPYMARVVADIPSGVSVVASTNLFSFVANNPNAYSLLWHPGTIPHFPFNATHLPDDVLVSTSEWFAPSFLNSALGNRSLYGLRWLLYSSTFYPGSIFLYQLGYSGSTNLVEVTPFPAQTVLCGNDFALGPSGVVVSDVSSRCGSIIESHPVSNLSGNGHTIWYGPYSTVLPGNYTVIVSLRGELAGPGPANAPIVVLNTAGLGAGYWYDAVISANLVSMSHWTNFTYHYQLNQPVPDAEWRGFLWGVTTNGTFVPGFVQLNYIEIDYSAPSPPLPTTEPQAAVEPPGPSNGGVVESTANL